MGRQLQSRDGEAVIRRRLTAQRQVTGAMRPDFTHQAIGWSGRSTVLQQGGDCVVSMDGHDCESSKRYTPRSAYRNTVAPKKGPKKKALSPLPVEHGSLEL